MQFICPFCRGIVAVDNADCGQDAQCGHCGEVVTAPVSPVATNAVIGDFIILEELGRGGMGVVYLAHQISLDRPAALKVLADQYAHNTEFVVGFIKEARAAAKLNHPHIVQAYAVGDDNGIYFFAMENIDGETMKTVLKREGKIPIDYALAVIQQIAEALDYAWKEQRLIHRDIKPDNIMMTRSGRAKLADLGLARIAGEIEDTGGDEVMGTPQYISPEHLTGAEMDARSDIYSLGATLFHLITGRFAFEGRTAGDIARKHLESPVPNPRSVDPTISADIAYITMKMMAKDPDDRYQTAEALATDLRLVRQGKNLVKPKAKPAGAGKQFTMKKLGTSTQHVKTMRMNPQQRAQANLAMAQTLVATTTGGMAKVTTNSGLGLTLTESIRRKHERSAVRQIAIWISICLVVLIAAGAFVTWRIISDGKKASTRRSAALAAAASTVAAPAPVVSPTGPSPYLLAAQDALLYAQTNPGQPEDILAKVDQFFARNLQPDQPDEEAALVALLAVYVPIDEAQRVDPARVKLRANYLEARQQQQLAERERLVKADEDRRLRDIEKERLRLEQEQQQRLQQRIDQYATDVQQRRELMRERLINFGIQRQFDQALKTLKETDKETEAAKDEALKDQATEFIAWKKKMQDQVDQAQRLWEALSQADTAITLQVEVVIGEGAQRKNFYGKIIKIADGKLSLRTANGETATVLLDALTMRQKKRLLREAADKLLEEPSAVFHYLMITGEFKDALELADAVGPDWREELSTTALAYFTGRMKGLAQMDEADRREELQKLALKYRGMPELEQARKAVKP